eukprot:765203-Hanusia_phi.AAC.11
MVQDGRAPAHERLYPAVEGGETDSLWRRPLPATPLAPSAAAPGLMANQLLHPQFEGERTDETPGPVLHRVCVRVDETREEHLVAAVLCLRPCTHHAASLGDLGHLAPTQQDVFPLIPSNRHGVSRSRRHCLRFLLAMSRRDKNVLQDNV